jgi:aspartate oxidase
VNIFEQAEKIAQEKKAEAERERAARQRQIEWEAQYKASLQKQVDETLNLFDGKYGITRSGNDLTMNGKRIATIKVEWSRWKDQGEPPEECSGYVIARTVYKRYSVWEEVKATGCSDESFAREIAEYLDV